jgi:hypothetical protein
MKTTTHRTFADQLIFGERVGETLGGSQHKGEQRHNVLQKSVYPAAA